MRGVIHADGAEEKAENDDANVQDPSRPAKGVPLDLQVEIAGPHEGQHSACQIVTVQFNSTQDWGAGGRGVGGRGREGEMMREEEETETQRGGEGEGQMERGKGSRDGGQVEGGGG